MGSTGFCEGSDVENVANTENVSVKQECFSDMSTKRYSFDQLTAMDLQNERLTSDFDIKMEQRDIESENLDNVTIAETEQNNISQHNEIVELQMEKVLIKNEHLSDEDRQEETINLEEEPGKFY